MSEYLTSSLWCNDLWEKCGVAGAVYPQRASLTPHLPLPTNEFTQPKEVVHCMPKRYKQWSLNQLTRCIVSMKLIQWWRKSLRMYHCNWIAMDCNYNCNRLQLQSKTSPMLSRFENHLSAKNSPWFFFYRGNIIINFNALVLCAVKIDGQFSEVLIILFRSMRAMMHYDRWKIIHYTFQ